MKNNILEKFNQTLLKHALPQDSDAIYTLKRLHELFPIKCDSEESHNLTLEDGKLTFNIWLDDISSWICITTEK
jgi:hypothetical protein